ncbi:DUF418 domain-containing protein [Providencia alcalifaciens]|uniref:DUF418 domain-containing protein YeiB n=1 Tax=Providencia alcalifaciens TaxID=126385 RepID=UPI0012B5E6C3|nr:DUF418 domain-containing protein YeiB [Providencia alcalifaciens]MTC37386.1 DUF418 domain-containing protein [Providencia alcalifaciens]
MTSTVSVAPKSRIGQLDTVRGIAILGILLLNIFGFALPQAAYLNPYYTSEVSSSDAMVWVFFNLFFQGKFLGIFSLLFGATLGLLLYRPVLWQRSRLIILAMIGLIHGIGFWDGDILLAYALTGLIAIMLLPLYSANTLLKIATAIYLIGLIILFVIGSSVVDTSFWQITSDQAFLDAWQHRAGGMAGISYRAGEVATMIELLVIQYGWQLLAMMILGVLLLRNGWLKGQFTEQHYRKMSIYFIVPTVLIQSVALYFQSLFGWCYFDTSIVGYIINELMVPLQSLGYIALVYGFWGRFSQSIFAKALQNIGRMALSNYLLQTLICTTIFYHLGYFYQFTRLELLLFIPPIWGINVLFSYCWLRFFKQGPVEWCWRQLTDKLFYLFSRHQGIN